MNFKVMSQGLQNKSPRNYQRNVIFSCVCGLLALWSFSQGFAQDPSSSATPKTSITNRSPVGEIDSSPVESGLSGSKKALSPSQNPLGGAARSPFGGNREPGISPIELDVVRTSDGKLQIRSVNPQSKMAGKVKQSQVFNNWDEIWSAIGETADDAAASESSSHE